MAILVFLMLFLIFAYMKRMSKKRLSKGDRLNWTPLKEVKTISLASLSVSGRVLTVNDLSRKKSGTPKTVFVP